MAADKNLGEFADTTEENNDSLIRTRGSKPTQWFVLKQNCKINIYIWRSNCYIKFEICNDEDDLL
jgi:hypothetical protein